MTNNELSMLWLCEVAGASLGGGIVGSISGLGGGIVVVPVLTICMGMPIDQAIAASIVSVIAVSSGAGSVYLKDKITNVRMAMFLELSTAAGALLGAGYLARHIRPELLYILFGLILLFSLLPIFAKLGEELPHNVHNDRLATRLKLNGSYFDKWLGRQVHYNATGVPAALGIMFGAGIISGVLGIGAGVVKVLAFEVAMKVPTKVATATSNFMIGVTAAAGAGVYLRRGAVLPYAVVPVAIFVLIGAFLGTLLMERMSSSLLKKVFALVLAIAGAQMLVRGLKVSAMIDPHSQPVPAESSETFSIAHVSSWVLRGGVIGSAVVMLVGIIFTFAHGTISVSRMTTDGFDYYPGLIWRGILQGRGKCIIEAGIYLLVFTPILRVLASSILFAFVERDRLYAAITLAVLALTLAGLLWLG